MLGARRRLVKNGRPVRAFSSARVEGLALRGGVDMKLTWILAAGLALASLAFVPSASADIFLYNANVCSGEHAGPGHHDALCVGANGVCQSEQWYDGEHYAWQCLVTVNRGHLACANHSGYDDYPAFEQGNCIG